MMPSPTTPYIREFGIKANCYANCRIALVGEIVISSLGLVLFKRHGILSRTRQLAIPSFAFSSFRECAF
ncbi:hypothetical protein HMPREF1991_01795 [Hoylesella loescheii DSM 19665 = JCM 12249 = ATCC 15930]|uniref:Uncharacterized protein n=1 Tax=Hoylesella loescheii DSM 19665 = JCM 12249 = ATCC 15930 TaxID=1122985 RepID=A0A069QHE8_HOYLO|nr:hypothetical protein HMPREF1991_01795 [Hoylesella loescheii DSM 19665 = JCM 12249 = ATCC 15930]